MDIETLAQQYPTIFCIKNDKLVDLSGNIVPDFNKEAMDNYIDSYKLYNY